MKRLIYPAVAIMIIVGSAFTFIKSQNWNIGEDYSVKFTSDDPSGVFRGLKGTVNFDEKDLANSKFDVSIDVATINTGNGMKNTHAKSEKWFDAEKYPTIAFTSSSITKTATGFEAKGTLEMHGVKKEIVLPFTFSNNTFSANIEVNRLDYDIDDGKHPKMLPSMKVSITVPVTK